MYKDLSIQMISPAPMQRYHIIALCIWDREYTIQYLPKILGEYWWAIAEVITIFQRKCIIIILAYT